MVIARRTGLIEAEVDGELVGLHVDNGACYGFNKTATRVWALIEEPKSLEQLCEALTSEYEVDRETCERELLPLIDELESEKLIEVTRS